jgi:hypothetical protein
MAVLSSDIDALVSLVLQREALCCHQSLTIGHVMSREGYPFAPFLATRQQSFERSLTFSPT